MSPVYVNCFDSIDRIRDRDQLPLKGHQDEDDSKKQETLEPKVFTTRCTTDQAIKVDPSYVPTESDENTVEGNSVDVGSNEKEKEVLHSDAGSVEKPKKKYVQPSPRHDPDHYIDDV
ncbi:unnamed protein product [Chilo suppressalis]|uniref:Uncharacterized protein n=1 Tax=Chilo suppressalis TaxID=168631 RepID=A0ABN8B899_CHISP|nr:unnamed protein product [Chilo suppressalis]